MTIEKAFFDGNQVPRRIEGFFNDASVFIPNKYVVILFGEYVERAINSMKLRVYDEIASGDPLKEAHRANFEYWKKTHYDTVGKFVDLKWTCRSVNVPTVNSITVDGEYTIDTKKGIRYPLLSGHTLVESLSMSIIEDRKLMMYQFFNALTNEFYNPGLLRPKSSFQKVGIVVVPLINHEIKVDAQVLKNDPDFIAADYDKEIKDIIKDMPAQAFEFNSAVLKSMGKIGLDNGNTTTPMEFSVNFAVPNAFQKPFNTILSGLRNNTSDAELVRGLVSKKNEQSSSDTIDKLEYNVDNFEISKSDLKSQIPKTPGQKG